MKKLSKSVVNIISDAKAQITQKVFTTTTKMYYYYNWKIQNAKRILETHNDKFNLIESESDKTIENSIVEQEKEETT